MTTEKTPVEKLDEAIQTFINECNDSEYAWLLNNAVLSYEVMRIADDGEPRFMVKYALLRPGMGLSAGYGLAELGSNLVLDAIREPGPCDDPNCPNCGDG